jgi:hypothetical protein
VYICMCMCGVVDEGAVGVDDAGSIDRYRSTGWLVCNDDDDEVWRWDFPKLVKIRY